MRRCFIHVGTHKTGTTSLQHTLSAHSQKLEGFGFYYPRLGRPSFAPHGHHNFAWEISKDDRFRKEYGSIDDLLAEIADVPHDVILSSEDFECSAHHPEQFAAFIDRLRERQFDVKFIVYFRNQIDYAESLYITLLVIGLNIPFCKYTDEILRSGKLCWRSWIFPFDYNEFTMHLLNIDGAELIVRFYDAVKKGGLVSDFLSILGMHCHDLAILDDTFLNERPSTSVAIEAYYRNCVGRPLLRSEQVELTSHIEFVGPHTEMNEQTKRNFIEKFGASNSHLFSTYQISEVDKKSSERMRPELGKQMSMEDVFSAGLCDMVAESLKSAQRRDSDLNELD